MLRFGGLMIISLCEELDSEDSEDSLSVTAAAYLRTYEKKWDILFYNYELKMKGNEVKHTSLPVYSHNGKLRFYVTERNSEQVFKPIVCTLIVTRLTHLVFLLLLIIYRHQTYGGRVLRKQNHI